MKGQVPPACGRYRSAMNRKFIWSRTYAPALVLRSVDNPTRQAFVTEMVGQTDMPNAIALNSAIFNRGSVMLWRRLERVIGLV